jgi:hypothetical protein
MKGWGGYQGSPAKQTDTTKSTYNTSEEDHAKQNPYWYKIDGKKVPKYVYNKYKNKPGQMEGGGKTTNDPDASGRKAAIEKARSENKASKRATVLTEQQTKNLKK